MQLNLLHSDPDLIYEIFHSNCIVTAKGEGRGEGEGIELLPNA